MTEKMKVHVTGAGGGSDNKQHTPQEADDTLLSRAMLSILDLIGEGQIGGLVDGLKSVFLNDTPVQNPDGSYNFSNITDVAFRDGTPLQDPVQGFDSIESPQNVGVRVRADSPATVTITDANADRARLIVTIPSLMVTDKNSGDVGGTSVEYAIDVATDGGPFVPQSVGTALAAGVQIDHVVEDGYDCYVVTPTASAGTLPDADQLGAAAVLKVTGKKTGSVVVQRQYFKNGAWHDFDATPLKLETFVLPNYPGSTGGSSGGGE